MIGAHRCSGQSRIGNQSGYRVSLASYTAHSETPNDSNPNGEMIDAKVFSIFILLNFFFSLAVCNSSLSRAFGEFPNEFQGPMHMRIDVRVSFTLKCFIFSEPVAYSFPFQYVIVSSHILRHISSLEISQRP